MKQNLYGSFMSYPDKRKRAQRAGSSLRLVLTAGNHRNTKLIYIKPGADPRLPCAHCVSLCEPICTLLSWFSGLCSGIIHPLWDSILLRKASYGGSILTSYSAFIFSVQHSVARGIQPSQSALEHSHEPKSSFHWLTILPPHPQVSISSPACSNGTGKTSLSKYSFVMVVAVRVCWICWESVQSACDWSEDCAITGMLTTCRKVLSRLPCIPQPFVLPLHMSAFNRICNK